jgi:hypothetical protein
MNMTVPHLIDAALEDVGDAAKTLAVGHGASDFVDFGRYRPRTRTDDIELTVDRATLRSVVWRWSRLDDRVSQRFGHDLGGKAVLPFPTEISPKMYADEYTCQNIENRRYCNPT